MLKSTKTCEGSNKIYFSGHFLQGSQQRFEFKLKIKFLEAKQRKVPGGLNTTLPFSISDPKYVKGRTVVVKSFIIEYISFKSWT